MKFSPVFLFFFATVVDARRLFGSGGGGGGAIQRSSSQTANSVHRLHKVLNIGNDPREAIWTNRALNMEGF